MTRKDGRILTARIIDGKKIASKVRSEIAFEIEKFKSLFGFAPFLKVVLTGEDPASQVYVRNKCRAAGEVGLKVEVLRMPGNTTGHKLRVAINEINKDPRVHGLLVQLPLPDDVNEGEIIENINPLKDVDGVHSENLGLLFSGKARFVPATPLGVQRLLIETNVETEGAHVVIVGRSRLVGKPLAGLLLDRSYGSNSTITVCHTGTKNLPDQTIRGDIVVSATGIPGSIKGEMIKKNAVVIDVGTTRIRDISEKNGYRLAGDVVFDDVKQIASAITPVPGGVGPMTIAMMLGNVLLAAKIGTG